MIGMNELRRNYPGRPSKYLSVDDRLRSEKNGIESHIARARLALGWSLEEAISKEVIRKGKKRWSNEIYALYKGENFITEGTVFEIAEATGKRVERIKMLNCPSTASRNKGDGLSLIYLGDLREEEF